MVRQRHPDGHTETVSVCVPVQTRRENSKAFEQEGTPERQIHLHAMEVSAQPDKSWNAARDMRAEHRYSLPLPIL